MRLDGMYSWRGPCLPFISVGWFFRCSSGTVRCPTSAQAKKSVATIAPSKPFAAEGANHSHLHPNFEQGFAHWPESGLMPPLGSRLAMMLVQKVMIQLEGATHEQASIRCHAFFRSDGM
jgi:hypothetical protein